MLSPSSGDVRQTRNWRQELMQRPQKSAAYWFILLVCSTCFLKQLNTTSWRVSPPTVSWTVLEDFLPPAHTESIIFNKVKCISRPPGRPVLHSDGWLCEKVTLHRGPRIEGVVGTRAREKNSTVLDIHLKACAWKNLPVFSPFFLSLLIHLISIPVNHDTLWLNSNVPPIFRHKILCREWHTFWHLWFFFLRFEIQRHTIAFSYWSTHIYLQFDNKISSRNMDSQCPNGKSCLHF